MVKYEKIQVKDKIVSDFQESLGNLTIDEAVEFLQKQKEKWLKKGYSNVGFVSDIGYEYTELVLVGFRLETDDEFKARVAKLEKIRKQKEKRQAKRDEVDRATYERLKKKFG